MLSSQKEARTNEGFPWCTIFDAYSDVVFQKSTKDNEDSQFRRFKTQRSVYRRRIQIGAPQAAQAANIKYQVKLRQVMIR